MPIAPQRSIFPLTILIVLWATAGSICAFEQGSYYLFDFVENESSPSVPGRLPVPKAAMEITENSTGNLTHSPQTRSEFEIDYTKSFQAQTTSDFGIKIGHDPQADTVSENTSFSTESFDFGSSNTVFGD